ncbi:MAG: MFS transporter [Chloroflexota bacterium]
MSDRSRSLLRHPDFLKLWTGETVSVFGDAITGLAVPLIAASVLNVTAFEFGLLNTLGMLPFIVLSLPAGVWVDRMRRRPIMIVADMGRAAALATIPLAFAFNALTIWQLYGVAIVVGALTVFFDVAYQSYLPSIVDRDQLVDGNGKLQITQSAAQILGPGAAGALIGLLTAPIAMLLDAASFVWSAVFIGWIRKAEPPIEPHDESMGPKPSMRTEMAAGLRYVTGHIWLRSIAATTGLANLFGQIANSIFVLYLVRDRGLSAEQIGLAFSLGSFGVLLGALVAARMAKTLGLGRTLVISAFGFGLEWGALAIAPEALIWPATIVSVFLGGFCGVTWNVNQVSLRQAITPPRMQGRMNASMRFIVWGTIPVGALIGGALGGVIGLRETITVGAVGALIAFLPVTLSPVRSLREMPAPAEDEAPASPTA